MIAAVIPLPRRHPRAFLGVMAIGWLALYLGLEPLSEWLVSLLPVSRAGHLGGAIQFFLFDTPKVLLLLTGITFVMGMVNSYFTPERTRALLAGKTFTTATIEIALASLKAELDPMADLHNDAATKRHLASVLARRLLSAAQASRAALTA